MKKTKSKLPTEQTDTGLVETVTLPEQGEEVKPVPAKPPHPFDLNVKRPKHVFSWERENEGVTP